MIQTDVDLPALLTALHQQTGVPGLTAAVSVAGRRQHAAAGLANQPEGIEMTPDTLFLLGSVTKVWVATLVLRLVERELLSLDAPVRQYLPDFRVADAAATDAITVRQLLNHSSGIDAGDYIVDFGEGDDCLDRYVRSLADAGQISAPGERFSYCNAGWVVAGRLVEEVTGLPFHDALRRELLEPLGLRRTVTSAREAVLMRVASGHWRQADGSHRRTDTWCFPRAVGPAGSTLTLTAGDLATFGEMHLRGGAGPDGERVLGAEMVALMQQPTLPFPVPAGASIGLGWAVGRAGELTILQHTGGSPGGEAVLLLVPSEDVAVAAFCNSSASGIASAVARQVLIGLFGDRASAGQPQWPHQPDPEEDLGRYAGVYERRGVTTTVAAEADRLVVSIEVAPYLQPFVDVAGATIPLAPAGGGGFHVAGMEGTPPVAVFEGDGPRAERLFFGGRLALRAG